MADPEVSIEVREALVVAVDPDGTETVLGTYERLVRMALGEMGAKRIAAKSGWRPPWEQPARDAPQFDPEEGF